MLVFGSLLLSIIPVLVIIYVCLKRESLREFETIYTSFDPQFKIQWDNAVQGLVNAEIENGIGNLDYSDYQWIRNEYINEAALALRSMKLTKSQEEILLNDLHEKITFENTHSDAVEDIVDLRKSE